jgi:tRNA 2-selenouridine synthase
MLNQITVEEHLNSSNKLVIIDVRSPSEFTKGHINGAINIPLFSDKERAKIGTLYKQKGREEAVLEGLDIVGPKLKNIVTEVKQVASDKRVVLYCWRGGMRSSSVAWLLNTAGFNVSVIKGGYKAYRRYLLEQFTKSYKLVMLGGPTGSKKTEILHCLRNIGEQVIDIEALAHHKGSAFGNLEGIEQPSTETFENNLALELMKMNKDKVIWLEDESKTIGIAHIPHEFWLKMKTAPLIYMELPFESRVNHIVNTYGNFPKENLQKAIDKIKKRLGGLAHKEAIDALLNNDLRKTAKILLQYYDAAYYYNSHKRLDKSSIYHLKFDYDEPNKIANNLLMHIKKINIPIV